MSSSFYWYDYETWGASPRTDRIAQFAGLRTDENFNPIGDPLVIYCKPPRDMLPHPEACMVTGITPQKAEAEGFIEAEFISLIEKELTKPQTCTLGYNSLRFDDEFTRYTLYRNFYDPYAREWRHGNSRWDLIDMVRLTHALRPEGIVWPKSPQGDTTFRLEELTKANGIEHRGAHDALVDVHATIELARLIRDRQPRLYEYVLTHRHKNQVAPMLDLNRRRPVLHVSSKYPASRGCIALVVPLMRHPTNQNGIVVYDLSVDPTPFLELSEDELHQRLFSPREELPEGVERLPVKTVHINRCPVLAPVTTLTPEMAEKWSIDVSRATGVRERLLSASDFVDKIGRVHQMSSFEPIEDPDQSLYSGGFFSDADRHRMSHIQHLSPAELRSFSEQFDDARLPEMLFRYRARNWPGSLSSEEEGRWKVFCRSRLFDPASAPGLQMDEYLATLDKLEADPGVPDHRRGLIPDLLAWAEYLAEVT